MRAYKIKEVPKKDTYEYVPLQQVYDEQCNEALTKIGMIFTWKTYEHFMIANPKNGIHWSNLCRDARYDGLTRLITSPDKYLLIYQ